MPRKPPAPQPDPQERPGFWQAFASTEQAILLGAAGVTAAAASAPWFLALGIAGYGVLAYNRFRRIREERAALRFILPAAPQEGLGERERELAEGARSAAQAVLDEIARSPASTQGFFGGCADQVRALYEKSLALVRRIKEVRDYLERTDARRLSRELDEMKARASREGDPQAREQYAGAAEAIGQSLANRALLERDAGRMEAQLAGIRSGLESVLAKVVRVRSAEAHGQEGESEAAARALDRLGAEVDAVARAVDEVFVESRLSAGEAGRRKGE